MIKYGDSLQRTDDQTEDEATEARALTLEMLDKKIFDAQRDLDKLNELNKTSSSDDLDEKIFDAEKSLNDLITLKDLVESGN